MSSRVSRRKLLQAVGTAALASSARTASAQTRPAFSRMPSEGKDTPKICLGFWATVDAPNMRRVKQIGVDHVLTGGPRIPWDEADVRARIDRFKAGGLTLYNMMISGFDDVIWGGPNAEAQIADVITSIRAAGKAGLPVIEYNFYANRLMEGYKEEVGRAGAGYTAYDYTLSKNLPPKDGVGTHTRADQLNAPSTSSRPSCPKPRRRTSVWPCTRTIRPCRSAAGPSRSWRRSSTGSSISIWSRARSTA